MVINRLEALNNNNNENGLVGLSAPCGPCLNRMARGGVILIGVNAKQVYK